MKPKGQKVIICKGLPASGKSGWSKKFVRDNPDWKRINKDSLRGMIHDGKFDKPKERLVEQVRDEMLSLFLRLGHNVIIDDTNLNPNQEERIREIVAQGGDPTVEIEVKFFDISLDEALARNALRTEAEGKVPAEVIKNMHSRWLNNYNRHDYREHTPGLPEVVIFDLDGTLAIHRGRDPYDMGKCETDGVNEPVARFLRMSANDCLNIVFMSGRNEAFRPQTESWLRMHGFMTDREPLFMRADGDARHDSIVKRELYEKHIEGRYNVIAVFDDRNSVVKTWRQLRLPCFQVSDGNF